MLDLSALSPALALGPIMSHPRGDALENADFPAIDFARLLGLRLGTSPLIQPRAAAADGKEGPASGKSLPDPDSPAPQVPEAVEAEPLNTASPPVVVAPSLPLVTTAPDPKQPATQSAERGTPLPSALTPANPLDPAAPPALPIHRAPRAAEALAARLDLRFEAQPAKLPAQISPHAAKVPAVRPQLQPAAPPPELAAPASARAIAVHAACLAGLGPGPGPVLPRAGAAVSSLSNHVATQIEPVIAPAAQGLMPDASPSGRSGKAPKEQTLAPRGSLPAPVGERSEPVLATPATPSPVAAPNLSITATPTPEAPRADFAALVERLAQARDAAGAEPVRLALRHAEFGQIALRIRSDESGLSVTLASPDPDFARAVSTAVPAAAPAQGGESLPQSDPGQSRPSGGASSGSDPGSHNRSSTAPERRAGEERHRLASSRPDRDSSGETRSGIFA
jgi:hypothetical protein